MDAIGSEALASPLNSGAWCYGFQKKVYAFLSEGEAKASLPMRYFDQSAQSGASLRWLHQAQGDTF